MPDLIFVRPFVADQQRVFMYNRHVGFCGTLPGMGVNFLAGKNCTLTDDERADVVEFVSREVGEVGENKQNRKVFDVLRERRRKQSVNRADSTSQ